MPPIKTFRFEHDNDLVVVEIKAYSEDQAWNMLSSIGVDLNYFSLTTP